MWRVLALMEAIAVVLIAMNESTKREDYLAFYLFKFAVMLKQINEQKLFGLLHRLVVTFKNIWVAIHLATEGRSLD